jgi:hypothetical protein
VKNGNKELSYVVLITSRVAKAMLEDAKLDRIVYAGGFPAAGPCIIGYQSTVKTDAEKRQAAWRPRYEDNGQREFQVTLWVGVVPHLNSGGFIMSLNGFISFLSRLLGRFLDNFPFPAVGRKL